ncbi:TetR/AcrR family transcriptional regulator [Coprobacter fastidiosus]|jgi:AcrR family transcriptional regulator|uniref:TetR/AcrR family transcriptional regulator n=1 Tax=Coprobacter fastidiosus TaxID=1099853 RepID=UPI00241F986F|nr:TetR/AcrR family transcriptional regulator [Coprobacter fastidiosus]
MEREPLRNRKATERRLLSAIQELIEEFGFEKLGINAVASKAGVSKMLIYRYFGSLDGLVAAYIEQYDFWINFKSNLPDREGLEIFIKEMFHCQIAVLRENYTLRRLYRWELMSDNKFVKDLRRQRENKGVWLIEAVSRLSGHPCKEVAVIATLLSASISYLALLEENCDFYNGISLQTDEGWEQLQEGIDALISLWISKLRN